MQQLDPIIVIDRFPEILAGLLDLLESLDADEWRRPTACAGWSVKDVALHLLGGDIGILSRSRDRHVLGANVSGWEDLVALINNLNAEWVQVARRVSARLLCDLLRFTGPQVNDYFRTLDPHALGGPVSWAGPDPAPIWLNLAREYTERWHHQQHIRDAVGRPGFMDPRYLGPALAAFVYGLPRAYRDVVASDGTIVALTINGPAGGAWSMLRERDKWMLYGSADRAPAAELIIDQDLAWRLCTRGVSAADAGAAAIVKGDAALARQALEIVALIA